MTAQPGDVPFVKAHACGNDFLIIEGMLAPPDIADFTRRICDRHLGIGADGVEWLFPAEGADARARLFNSDGSEAEISGNGTRCVAAYLCSEHDKETIVVQTGAGLKTCQLTARSAATFEFEVGMGNPEVGQEFPIELSSGKVSGLPVSMGNPHYVVIVEKFDPQWQVVAAEICRHSHFQHGVNVELVMVEDRGAIGIRLFERGVGETRSSGTGSCAAAVACITTRRVASPVRVHAPGGTQIVRWDQQVFLRGPAQLVGRGEFFG